MLIFRTTPGCFFRAMALLSDAKLYPKSRRKKRRGRLFLDNRIGTPGIYGTLIGIWNQESLPVARSMAESMCATL